MNESIHYLPILLDCREQHVLIVGGGQVAERKSLNLLQAGAKLTIISPTLTATLHEWVDQQQMIWHCREYQAGDITKSRTADKQLSEFGYRPYLLVHAVTSFPEINMQVAREARSYGIPVNVAHRCEESTFINPNVIRRGRLTIAVATAGAGPLAGRQIAQELDDHFGNEYEVYIDFLYQLRKGITSKVNDSILRKRLLQKAMTLPILEEIRQGTFEPWNEQQIEHWISQSIE